MTATTTVTTKTPAALPPLDPDNESDALPYVEVVEVLGPVPQGVRMCRVGVVLKFLGNRYWQLLAAGVQRRADALGCTVDVRAATTENDPQGQALVMEEMLALGYDAFIVAPQTDVNLQLPVATAREQGRYVLVVNEVVADAEHWVGPHHYTSGALAGEYLGAHLPAGAQVGLIEGLPGAYASRQRALGFRETLGEYGLDLVGALPANWDAQQALEATQQLWQAYPRLQGLYCSNDVMALGAMMVFTEGDDDAPLIVGTDGIDQVYGAMRRGEIAATVDIAPEVTGEIAVELVVRLLAGQEVPRVVYSPQTLVTASELSE